MSETIALPFAASGSPAATPQSIIEITPGTRRIYPKANARIQSRRAVMQQIIAELGGVPTHFDLLNELAERGVKSSKGTVMNDLFALGLSDAATAYGRPAEPVSGEPSEF